MAAQSKYQQVIDLMHEMNLNDVSASEQGGSLVIKGTANTQYEKNMVWDKIKQIGGENPSDIQADIKVSHSDYFALHKVKSGDTLGAISKKYLGDTNRYKEIAQFNGIEDPDKIQAGQEIKIPNK